MMNRTLLGEPPLLPVAQQAAKHPAFAHCSSQTIQRWAKVGIKRRGMKVKLESIRVGSYLCTSLPALDRFLFELNSQPAGELNAA